MQRHSSYAPSHSRSGWTLVELLVTMTIIGVLLAILFPAFNAIRESARKTTCQNNLRQIGIALHAFADQDPKERFVTGASDFLKDGCPGQIGWLADIDRVGALDPEGVLCPSNPARGAAFLQQMLKNNTNDASVTADPSDITASFCSAFDPGDAGYLATGSARATLIAEQVRKGFNTNYTPSWFLVRGQIHTDAIGQLPGSSGRGLVAGPFREREFTQGGLRRGNLDIMSQSDPIASQVPLMGDGQSGNALLEFDLSDSLIAGTPLVESFTLGPAVYDVASTSLEPLQGSAANPLDLQAIQPTRYPQPGDVVGHGGVGNNETTYQDNSGDWTAAIGSAAAQKLCLQDTRGWRPLHRGSLNLLMADGSVQSVQDQNGDGFINPGFPVEPADGGYKLLNQTVGYTDGVVEMSSVEVFGGTFLHFKRDDD